MSGSLTDRGSERGSQVVVAGGVLEYLEGFRNYLRAYQKSAKTVKVYLERLTSFAEKYWPKSVVAFTSQEWDNWLCWQAEKGWSPNTIVSNMTAVRRFYKFLRRKRIVTHDPGAESETIPRRRAIPVWLTEDEVLRLFEKAASPKARAALEILYGCGLRVMELEGLKLGDYLPSGLRILGKRGKEAIQPITPRVKVHLDEWLKHRDAAEGDERLFPGYSIRELQKMVKGTAYRAGFRSKPITPHTLRHSIATHLLKRCGNLNTVKEFLRHDSISTTQIYVHMAQNELQEAIEQFHPLST